MGAKQPTCCAPKAARLVGPGVGPRVAALALAVTLTLVGTAIAALRFTCTPAASAPSVGLSTGTSANPGGPVRPRPRRGGMDATFFVTSDTHLGLFFVEAINRRSVKAMNDLPGTAFPRAIGGEVGHPFGVLVAGDLTEDGRPEQWARFEAFYGLTGSEGLLRYPVYENYGNHDKSADHFVRERVVERHGSVRYAVDEQDLHVVTFGEAPNHEDLDWLERDLAEAGRDLGIVIMLHFPLRGPYSNNWFGDGDYRERLHEVIADYHVLGIFHGHYHLSGAYRWKGYDVYNVGTPVWTWRSFAVVRITDETFTVASFNYDDSDWWWWHQKPIFGAPGEETRHLPKRHRLIGGD